MDEPVDTGRGLHAKRIGGPVVARGFRLWKWGFLRQYLQGRRVWFLWRPRRVGTVLVWGAAPSRASGAVRVEDGFLRSVGLGADLVWPLSLCFDDLGIYYDAGRPSRLETLLAGGTWTADDIARAAALRRSIVSAGISKYNVGSGQWSAPKGRRVVLVIGQVEDDASVRLGSPKVQSNLALLQSARADRPTDWLVYKPHPDVVAGARPRGDQEEQAEALADEIVRDVPLAAMWAAVDEVHVMTSLAGFEAVLRGVPVVCHGLPFYAGWGLTHDRMICDRRGRQLTLDELVHGCLIDYPTYLNPRTARYITPEAAVALLATGRPGRRWPKSPKSPRWPRWAAIRRRRR